MTRKRIIYFLIPILFFLTSFVALTIQVYFSGEISSKNPAINSQIIGLHLFVKADNKIIAKTEIDTTKNYSINFSPIGQRSFDFFITGIGVDTMLLRSYKNFQSDIIIWNIELPIKYKKVFGKVVCPKCNRTELVYPIIYTNPPLVKQLIKNKDTVSSHIVNSKYYSNTDVHGPLSPSWYCYQDDVKF